MKEDDWRTGVRKRLWPTSSATVLLIVVTAPGSSFVQISLVMKLDTGTFARPTIETPFLLQSSNFLTIRSTVALGLFILRKLLFPTQRRRLNGWATSSIGTGPYHGGYGRLHAQSAMEYRS